MPWHNLVLHLSLAATPLAVAAPPPDVPSRKPAQAADAGLASAGLGRFLAVGKSAERVRFSSPTPTGAVASITSIEKLTRIDEANYAMEGMTILSFDNKQTDPKTGKPLPTTVEISVGTFHEPSKTLNSDHPCRIRKPEFDLTGRSLRYDAIKGISIFKGPVRMVIYPLDGSPQE